MGFWLRNLIFGSILSVTAYILLTNEDVLTSVSGLFDSNDVIEDVKPAQTVETTEVKSGTAASSVEQSPNKKVEEKKSTNAAAEGLSRFYASINPSYDEKASRVKENIVYLPKPKGKLSKILEARKMVTRPLRKNWRGNKESRPFRVGETLFQKLSEYGQQQGIEVVWWLDRDFLVKDPFRIDKDILKTAFQIGKAIEGHFQNGINVFFCYQHRTVVLIDEEDNYLTTECTLLEPKRTTW